MWISLRLKTSFDQRTDMNPQIIRENRQNLAKAERDRKAEEFLLSWLEKGPAFVPAVKLAAKRQGVSWASVRLARHTKGVKSLATIQGQIWSLPDMVAPLSDKV